MATVRTGVLSVARPVVAAILALVGGLYACSTGPGPAPAPPSGTGKTDFATYHKVKAALDKDGPIIDYDTLMDVYRTMVRSPRPIAHTEGLVRQLIYERNQDPRVDQMVLILAAKIMGSSRHVIPGAQKLFASILEQEDRIDPWVLSYVAEAVGDYAFDLPQGDRLADQMATLLDRIVSRDRSGKEAFGHHFLPPPRSVFVRDYINGIAAQGERQAERTRYYFLVRNNFSEERIVSALKYLQRHGAPDTGDKCRFLMQCAIRFLMPLR
jgi:hypothetical protein